MGTNYELEFKLVAESGVTANPKIKKLGKQGYSLTYPCSSQARCTAYESTFPSGSYLIKAFGASGGGNYISYRNTQDKSKCNEDDAFFGDSNIDCVTSSNTAGAGALISGILKLNSPMKLYFLLGGSGKVLISSNSKAQGGYNGGGDGLFSSGGGSTDVRAVKNTPFSRILVAGGGGGTDDNSTNDGIGGSAGGLTAQSFWVSGYYQSGYEATQKFGFSFFQGEGSVANQAQSCHEDGYKKGYNNAGEHPGAGGGWYGGFSSHHRNGGAGGGSSFALTLDSDIPNEVFPILDKSCNTVDQGRYEFVSSRPAYFEDVSMKSGAWQGNGKIEIFVLNMYNGKEGNNRKYIDFIRMIIFGFLLA